VDSDKEKIGKRIPMQWSVAENSCTRSFRSLLFAMLTK